MPREYPGDDYVKSFAADIVGGLFHETDDVASVITVLVASLEIASKIAGIELEKVIDAVKAQIEKNKAKEAALAG